MTIKGVPVYGQQMMSQVLEMLDGGGNDMSHTESVEHNLRFMGGVRFWVSPI